MIVSIMQPTFMPWLGYFDMIDKVDQFIFLDHVQLTKRSWQVRNKIKIKDQEKLVTIPIKKEKNRDETFICSAKIDYSDHWHLKFLNSIEQGYKNSKFYKEIFPLLEKVIKTKTSYLADLNINLITELSHQMGMSTKFQRSSNMKTKGQKDKMLVEILKLTNCTNYLSAPGSYDYIERYNPGGEFTKNNIQLFYHVYDHPTYNQLYGNFLSHLGILDLVFNVGLKNALQIIKKGRTENIYYKQYKKD